MRLILGDCREHAQAFAGADILLTDGPYGIGYKVNARREANRVHGLKATGSTVTAPVPMIAGDDVDFDPAPWLAFPRVALFGADHFAGRLPKGGSWVVWDKRRDSTPDDHSDCEFVWLSVPGPARIHRQKWRGVVREGEENCSRSRKLHPNQKPVALLAFLLKLLKAQPGETVADPFMGSGSSGVAALRDGLDFIGCEIDPQHFATATDRLATESALWEGTVGMEPASSAPTETGCPKCNPSPTECTECGAQGSEVHSRGCSNAGSPTVGEP